MSPKPIIVPLESLRGICALCVAIMHFQATSPIYDLSFVRNSYIFVDFFFVLSGFVISHAYGHALSSRIEVWQFLVRRFARLYPLHFATLAFLVLLELLRWGVSGSAIVSGNALFAENKSLAALLANLALVQVFNLFPYPTWNPPSWSISAECWTYLFYATVMFALPRFWLPLAALLVGLLTWAFTANSMSDLQVTVDYGFFRCVLSFGLGSLAYIAYEHVTKNRIYTLLRSAHWTLIESVIFFALVSGVSFLPTRYFICAPYFFVIVVLAVSMGSGSINRLLCRRSLLTIGMLSYSIYLIHVPLQSLMFYMALVIERCSGFKIITSYIPGSESPFIGPNAYVGTIMYVVMISLLIGISLLCYQKIEVPWRRRIRAMAEGPQTFEDHSAVIGAISGRQSETRGDRSESVESI